MGYFELDYCFSDLCGSNAEHTPKLPNRQVGLIFQNATPQSQVSGPKLKNNAEDLAEILDDDA